MDREIRTCDLQHAFAYINLQIGYNHPLCWHSLYQKRIDGKNGTKFLKIVRKNDSLFFATLNLSLLISLMQSK